MLAAGDDDDDGDDDAIPLRVVVKTKIFNYEGRTPTAVLFTLDCSPLMPKNHYVSNSLRQMINLWYVYATSMHTLEMYLPLHSSHSPTKRVHTVSMEATSTT